MRKKSNYDATHAESAMDSIRGAYCDVGSDDFDWDGEPNPDIPETLYLLLEDAEIVGRLLGIVGGPIRA